MIKALQKFENQSSFIHFSLLQNKAQNRLCIEQNRYKMKHDCKKPFSNECDVKFITQYLLFNTKLIVAEPIMNSPDELLFKKNSGS